MESDTNAALKVPGESSKRNGYERGMKRSTEFEAEKSITKSKEQLGVEEMVYQHIGHDATEARF